MVHCLVLRDLDSDTVVSCTDHPEGRRLGYRPIEEGLRILRDAEKAYAHNGVKFDVPVLEELHNGFALNGKLLDTMVVAGALWPGEYLAEKDYVSARKGNFPAHLAGSHSLEAWGHRLGVYKGDYTDWCKAQGVEPWEQWRPEMQTYCEGDTETTKALVLFIQRHGIEAEVLETEMEVADYLARQERNGVPFDIESARALCARLMGRREELAQKLREEFIAVPVRNGGKHAEVTPKRDNKKQGIYAGCPYTKVKFVDFNPGSRKHIENRLKVVYGWTPTVFSEKSGDATVDEKTLKGLDYPPVKLLLEYLMVDKRIGQVADGKEAWLTHARQDGRYGGKLTGLYHIHGRVNQNKTVTHRASHSGPNLGQVPKVGNPYGEDCRSLFIVPPGDEDDPDGWVMVGADKSSLEARCLSHYMHPYDGGAYGTLLLTGDVHSANRDALGLPTTKEGRDTAKTWFYGFLYGSGDEKAGAILSKVLTITPKPGESRSDAMKRIGKKCKAQFFAATPALKLLIDDVKAAAKKKGYLRLPDGRKVYIRSDHSALNFLLQGAGAVICKRWIVTFNRKLVAEFGQQGWNGQWAALLWVHDEVQLAVRRRIADRVQELLVESAREMTEHFSWRCQLDGEAKVGRNWAETH